EHMFRSQLRFMEPSFRRMEHKRQGLRDSAGAYATINSEWWSGAVVFAPAGTTMSWIVAQWTVPNVYLPANAVDGQWYSAFSWVGLDGAGSNDVLLAGYSSGVMTSGGVLHRLAGPIWGWVPDHDHVIMNFPITEGDRISVMVGRSSATQGYIIMNNDTALTQ